eukprot:NODE_1_length_95616_cov_0.657642.p53 type:complete len:215 gc:universal NODE_1_length_95616_cov_0.657642:60828-60184(-)
MAKAKTADIENIATQILKYLKETNRPYSATDISLNLQLKKTATSKALADMAANDSIAFKENGKQVIYYVHQDEDGQTPEEEEVVLQQTKELEESIAELKATVQSNTQFINEIAKDPSDEDLLKELEELGIKRDKLSSSLDLLKEQPMDLEEKDHINKSYIAMLKLWKTRKSKAMEIVYELSDKMEKKPSELVESIGIETDEDVGCSYSEMIKYL